MALSFEVYGSVCQSRMNGQHLDGTQEWWKGDKNLMSHSRRTSVSTVASSVYAFPFFTDGTEVSTDGRQWQHHCLFCSRLCHPVRSTECVNTLFIDANALSSFLPSRSVHPDQLITKQLLYPPQVLELLVICQQCPMTEKSKVESTGKIGSLVLRLAGLQLWLEN